MFFLIAPCTLHQHPLRSFLCLSFLCNQNWSGISQYKNRECGRVSRRVSKCSLIAYKQTYLRNYLFMVSTPAALFCWLPERCGSKPLFPAEGSLPPQNKPWCPAQWVWRTSIIIIFKAVNVNNSFFSFGWGNRRRKKKKKKTCPTLENYRLCIAPVCVFLSFFCALSCWPFFKKRLNAFLNKHWARDNK